MLHRFILSKLDRLRLSALLRDSRRVPLRNVHAELSKKIERATLCEPDQIPSAVVTMNSRAWLVSEHWGPRECSLVYPEDADRLRDRVSVLSPFGVQLLGAREGELIRVPFDETGVEFQLLGLTYQPEAQKHWHR
jgi:regulator of nucleoside diphosphate kinase